MLEKGGFPFSQETREAHRDGAICRKRGKTAVGVEYALDQLLNHRKPNNREMALHAAEVLRSLRAKNVEMPQHFLALLDQMQKLPPDEPPAAAAAAKTEGEGEAATSAMAGFAAPVSAGAPAVRGPAAP
eukprot:5660551-Pyramimonas_sp.AAC.1